MPSRVAPPAAARCLLPRPPGPDRGPPGLRARWPPGPAGPPRSRHGGRIRRRAAPVAPPRIVASSRPRREAAKLAAGPPVRAGAQPGGLCAPSPALAPPRRGPRAGGDGGSLEYRHCMLSVSVPAPPRVAGPRHTGSRSVAHGPSRSQWLREYRPLLHSRVCLSSSIDPCCSHESAYLAASTPAAVTSLLIKQERLEGEMHNSYGAREVS